MFRPILFAFLSLLLFSCGKNADEKTADAILSANISLSKSDCQAAITTLEENGRVNNSAAYLKTLASAYACRAGYSTTVFFSDDLSKAVSPAPLGGTATFSTSQKTFQNPLQNDASFIDLQTAIDILLYAGGIALTTEPTTTERKKYFSTLEVGDIDALLLYMEFVQLGRFLYVYGNSSALGVKGGGNSGNNCLTSYSNAPAPVKAALIASGLTCNSINSSNSQLDGTLTASTRKTRLCQGVVLLNGVLALLPSLVSSVLPASQQDAANTALDSVTTAKALLVTLDPSIGQVLSTQSQAACEDDSIVSVSSIESYYAGLFESVFE